MTGCEQPDVSLHRGRAAGGAGPAHMVLLSEGRLCPGSRRRDGSDLELGAVQPGGGNDGSVCGRRAGEQGACQAPAAADRLTPCSARPPTASHRPGGLAAGSTPPSPSLTPRPSSPPSPSLTEGLRCLWKPLLLQRRFHRLLLRSACPSPIAHRARIPFPSHPAPCALGQRFLASPDHLSSDPFPPPLVPVLRPPASPSQEVRLCTKQRAQASD